jgi:hypothetical protein
MVEFDLGQSKGSGLADGVRADYIRKPELPASVTPGFLDPGHVRNPKPRIK